MFRMAGISLLFFVFGFVFMKSLAAFVKYLVVVTWSIRPCFLACLAVSGLPVSMKGMACRGPILFTVLKVPPHPGWRPSLTSGRPILVLGLSLAMM